MLVALALFLGLQPVLADGPTLHSLAAAFFPTYPAPLPVVPVPIDYRPGNGHVADASGAIGAPGPLTPPAESWTPFSHAVTDAAGVTTLDVYPGAQFVQNRGGWTPIDPTVVATGGGSYTVPGALVPLGASAAALTLHTPGGDLSLRLPSGTGSTSTSDAHTITFGSGASAVVAHVTAGGLSLDLPAPAGQGTGSVTLHLSDTTRRIARVQQQSSTAVRADLAGSGLSMLLEAGSRSASSAGTALDPRGASLSVVPSGDGQDVTATLDASQGAGAQPLEVTLSWTPAGAGLAPSLVSYSDGGSDCFGCRAGTTADGSPWLGTAPDLQPHATAAAFDTSSIPSDAVIASASLQVATSGCAAVCPTAADAISARELTGPWTRSLAYNELRNLTGRLVDHAAADGGTAALDVTDTVRRWVAGRTPNDGLLLTMPGAVGGATLGTATLGGTRLHIVTHPPTPPAVSTVPPPDQSAQSASDVGTHADTPAPAPTSAAASAVSVDADVDRALVTWSGDVTSPDFRAFRVTVTDNATSAQVDATSVSGLSSWVHGLAPGHTYTVSVVRLAATTESAPQTVSLTTPTTSPTQHTPAAPSGLTVTAGTTSAEASWIASTTDASLLAGYRVEAWTSSGTLVSTADVCGLCTVGVVTHLTPATSLVTVVALSHFGALSREVTAPVSPAPASPSASASPAPSGSASPTPAATSPSSPTPSATAAAAATPTPTPVATATPSPTSPTSSPTASPTAERSGGSGIVLASATTAAPTGLRVAAGSPPSAPQNLQANGADGGAHITWSPPASGAPITGYTANLYTSAGILVSGPLTCANCIGWGVGPMTGGQSYYWTVYATNANGNGPIATSATFTVPSTPYVTVAAVTSGAADRNRGEVITYSLTVRDGINTPMTVSSSTLTLSAGILPPLRGLTTMDGAACTASTSPTCSWSGQQLTVGTFVLTPNNQHVFQFSVTLVGSDRSTSVETLSGAATNTAGTASSQLSTRVWGGGIGSRPWWTMETSTLGPTSTVAFNPASGNLLFTASDGIPMALHGSLRFGLYRASNSSSLTATGQAYNTIGGANWALSFEDVTGPAAEGIYSPAGEDAADPWPVTVVGRDEERSLFTLVPLSAPIDATGLAGGTSVTATLAPQVLATDGTNTRVCIDAIGQAPTGVHLGLWRYIELQSAGTSTPCVAASGTTPTVLGYGVMRPDRLRYEFSWNGRKLSTTDAAGNSLRYGYANPPIAGHALGNLLSVQEVSSGRRFSLSYGTWNDNGTARNNVYVLDASGETWEYRTDVTGNLGTVHDETYARDVQYYNGGCSGFVAQGSGSANASVSQICVAFDQRGDQFALGYTPTYSDGSSIPGPTLATALSDRGGYLTNATYDHTNDVVTVTAGTHIRRYAQFTRGGSVSEVDAMSTSAPTTHVAETLSLWDDAPGVAPCRQPDPVADHNLCRSVSFSLSSGSNARDRSLVYNPLGSPLLSRTCLGSTDPSSTTSLSIPACSTGSADTSYGYQSTYLRSSLGTATFQDTVAGASAVTSQAGSGSQGARQDGQGQLSLFVVADSTQLLGPNGNAVSAAQSSSYLTTYRLDNKPTGPLNVALGSGVCSVPSTPAANSGVVCEQDVPGDTAVQPTRYTYTSDGMVATVATPLAIAQAGTGAPKTYALTYYSDSTKDLSQHTVQGGWLEAITDPLGSFEAYAYDTAGDRVRTWDRNATTGLALSAFPGTISSPASPAYTETLFGTGSWTYTLPSTYVLSRRDQLGDLTSYTVDANGNHLTVRPPRGNQANNASFDTVQVFDKRDERTSVTAPAEVAQGAATRMTYDQWSDVVSTTDPLGKVTTATFDALARQTGTAWTRAVVGQTATPANCRQSTSSDAPIPSGLILCTTSTAYDGLGHISSSVDANGYTTSHTYDGRGLELVRTTPRNDGTLTNLTTGYSYDRDGNVTLVCPPRAYTEGGVTTCSSDDHGYDTATNYTPADRINTVTAHRIGSVDEVTSYAYDADGNRTQVTDANTHPTTYTFNLLDRLTQSETHRVDGGPALDTLQAFDAAGHVTSTQLPSGSTTAVSYDAAGRPVDQVQGSSSLVATSAGTVSSDGGQNVRTRLQYDADGNVVAEILPGAFTASVTSPNLEFQRRYDYDADGRVTAVHMPRYDAGTYSDQTTGSNHEQTTECPTNTPGITDNYPGGTGVCITRYVYDAANHRIEVDLPTMQGASAARKVAYSYTDDNLLQVVTQPSFTTTGQTVAAATYSYDAAGRKVQVLDGLSRPTTWAYSADGLVLTKTDEPGDTTTHVTRYAYNAAGSVTATTDPLNQTTNQHFFSDDTLKDHIDAAGDTTSYSYDALKNPVDVWSPSANARDSNNSAGTPTVNTFTWDGQPLTTTVPVNPNGSSTRQTTYGYTADGLKASVTVGSPGTANLPSQLYAYYADDRMKSHTGTDGELITFQYDPAGTMSSAILATSGGTQTAITNQQAYLDELPRHVWNNGAAPTTSDNQVFAYDGGGNLVSRQVQTPQTVWSQTYAMSDALVPASASSSLIGGSWSWTYDAAGQMTQVSMPNGANVQQGYFRDGTLNTVSVNTPSLSDQWYYTYDADYHRLHQEYHGNNAVGGGDSIYWDYTYYNNNRLNTVKLTADGTQEPMQSATWDHDGDRTAWSNSNGLNSTYTYNADDSLSTGFTAPSTYYTYSYNAAGDLTSDTCRTYSYDGFEEMISSARAASPPTSCGDVTGATYSWDALGRQRAKQDSSFGNVVAQTFAGTSFSLNATQYLYGHVEDNAYALSSSGAALADTFAPTGFNRSEFFATDGHGSIATVLNGAKAVTCTAFTDTFGAPTFTHGSNTCQTGSTNSFLLFHSEPRDATTGGYQLQGRLYDPGTGTFHQPDRFGTSSLAGKDLGLITSAATRNPYSYVNGDPVNLIDPTGHCAEGQAMVDGVCPDSPSAGQQEDAPNAPSASSEPPGAPAPTSGVPAGAGSDSKSTAQQAHEDAADWAHLQESGDALRVVHMFDENSRAFPHSLPTDCMYYAGAAPANVDDGCDRNPGGMCHTYGGFFDIPCTNENAIPGVSDDVVKANEPVRDGPSLADLFTVASLLFPPAAEEDAAALAGRAIARSLDEGAADLAATAASDYAVRLAADRAGALEAGAEQGAAALNAAGRAYPRVLDPRSGASISFPGRGLSKVPVGDRVPWGAHERGAYIKEWYDRGYSTPEGGWGEYDIHHITPREYGGTNDFDNLVPVRRDVHQSEFNAWWRDYG